MCKVNWCKKPSLKYQNGNPKSYCSIHVQYKEWVSNAPTRPWLMYKLEKILAKDIACEGCGYDARKFHPTRPLRELIGTMDVDHVNSNLKHTFEGEQPSNYQLLCKTCHVLKSFDEGDFISKNNRK